jgi:negative regulator of flagellin synthesis FlgM
VGADAGISIEVGSAVLAANPPVNQYRVSEIRNALRDGSYPLVPTEIADAIIAARISFGMER